jgi:hypothetical protein
MTTKELFTSEIEKHWSSLKDRDDTIFENIEIQMDPDLQFYNFRENSELIYNELIHESSVYNKKKMIREYFWSNVVAEFYESTLSIMKQANLLEEAQKSFESSYKIENTARMILENGIFSNYNTEKKKELIDPILEMYFYPHSFYDNYAGTVSTPVLIEEGFGDFIIGGARFVNSLMLLMAYILISPATLLMSNLGTRAIDSMLSASSGGKLPNKLGSDPTARKFYGFLDHVTVVKFIFKFLNKDVEDLFKFLRKSNTLENEYIQDILKEAGANPTHIIQKCWEKNRFQASTSNTKLSMGDLMKHFFSGKAMANALRHPLYNDSTQLALLLKSDAAKPEYQKMFYNFRICVYEKLFEIILGFAKAIYSMDDASYEIIKAANDAHKTKNFKAFFDLRPKQDNEEAMFLVMKALVAIEDIAFTLEKRKGDLVADKYIDKFSDFLRQNIKQTYQQLDEMASQKKYNADRYEEEDPDDETKAKKIAEERFNSKKSIFA